MKKKKTYSLTFSKRERERERERERAAPVPIHQLIARRDSREPTHTLVLCVLYSN